MYHEQEQDDHYEDFIRTVGFLFDDDSKTEVFKEDLVRYRRELLNLDPNNGQGLLDAKTVIETKLRSIMVRTERISATADRDGMIQHSANAAGELAPKDLRAYAALDSIATHLDVGDTVEYWKSAPYLLNVMDRDGYKIKREFLSQVESEDHQELAQLVAGFKDGLLSWETIRSYQQCDPGNSKLRTLLGQKVDCGAWQLLWVPPSLPYYRPFGGPYADTKLQSFTKALVFSSWKVVPKVIAMLCSYEAERRMVSKFDESADYSTERTKRRPLLQFALSQGRLTGMSTFCLFYPCHALATLVDPLEAAVGAAQGGTIPDLRQVQEAVVGQVRKMLDPILARFARNEGAVDERWYWVALALLDKEHSGGTSEQWLSLDDQYLGWRQMVEASDDGETRFAQHVEEFARFLRGDYSDLGRPPQDLPDMLARVAMGSPAVTGLRAIMRVCRHVDIYPSTDHLLSGAAWIAMGFRSLFNLPESMTMIRSLEGGDDDSYWRSVLDYCIQGNLQSVLDEYVHVLRESLGLIGSDPDDVADGISDAIEEAVSVRTVSLDFDDIQVSTDGKRLIQVSTDGKKPTLPSHGMRCRFALRFGDGKAEDEGAETRADQVRGAFNSPFRPFVLASTSIGQEGLDFHQYCREIYHWNLPSNPIDMEQREGRIHRYKGHVIRQNVAATFSLSSLSGKELALLDPWRLLFDLAKARYPGKNDLIPYWIFEDGGHKVMRQVPALPLSRDVERLEDLRRTVVAYRMVLGQPRQQDLVSYLESQLRRGLNPQDLLKYRIDLSPAK